MIDDGNMCDRNFVAYLPDRFAKVSQSSIAELAQEPLGRPCSLRSYVVETSERAWITPIDQLTCEEARMLVSQKLGLAHICEHVAEFVYLYPRAEVSFYRGDFTLCVLRAFAEIKRASLLSVQRICDANLDSMVEALSWSRPLLKEAVELVAHARESAK
ncbi:hypothetical protein [Qipengyuania qiaonensis]|uniref:Uncharacterized protein n=1 Tax=Qipengyuania qiaonensis TaxID=2867240 RepID=A0ABS7J5D5_9SPHN|nr:hypothetical protein [Qipengyuania qiaonensis]MBX7482543.1 hypothetical protein [Qipengyuania qiaonensis]